MFAKLRAKLTAHHASSPHAVERDEFLAIGADTPIERKSHFTYQVVGAAAAYEAMKAFEHHEVVTAENKPTHARAKEVIVGLATGYAIRLIDEKGLPFTSEADKVKFKADAQRVAAADAKRGLRESGYFEHHELEGIDADELSATKI